MAGSEARKGFTGIYGAGALVDELVEARLELVYRVLRRRRDAMRNGMTRYVREVL